MNSVWLVHMIDHSIKIHDRFTLELKLGLLSSQQPSDRFAVKLWLFIPNTLDINRYTYPKADFYRDLKTYTRLITPSYSLADIAATDSPTLVGLESAIAALGQEPSAHHQAQYEYHVKMFVSALKSSLRETHVQLTSAAQVAAQPIADSLRAIINRYREQYSSLCALPQSDAMLRFYRFGDEYMSNLIELYSFKIIQSVNMVQGGSQLKEMLLSIIDDEMRYRREQGYDLIDPHNKQRNHDFVFRMGMLKKYAESHLYMNIRKRRDGILAEHVLYSIAAGISMVVATAIAFSFQRRYGNFTMPLFVALVVGYMLKDRIKELARYYFAHRMGSRYFDHKIDMEISGIKLGWFKETMDFIPPAKVPQAVLQRRGKLPIVEVESRVNAEQTLLYRANVSLTTPALAALSPYPIDGINSIIRFNVSSLLRKADNPEFPLFYPDWDTPQGYRIVAGERMYYLNLVLQFKHNGRQTLVPYRIAFNRNGIHSIESAENA